MDAATLILRLLASFPFIYAGIGKFGPYNAMVTGLLQKVGFPAATASSMTIVIGTLEILSGIGLILGLFTRLVALFQLIIPLSGWFIFKFDLNQGPAIWKDPTLMGAAIFLLIFGAGRYSLDARIARS